MDKVTKYPEDYKELIKFHGHSCPGLAIGYRVVKAAIEKGGLKEAWDEELVAIVENNSCSVDAVQFLLNCTFGKGNLVFRDYGKQVFTFAQRTTGKAIRVSMLPGALDHPEDLTEEERQEFREKMVEKILRLPWEKLVKVEDVMIRFPGEAEIHASLSCDICGEPTMETRTVEKDGRVYCIPCFDKLSRG